MRTRFALAAAALLAACVSRDAARDSASRSRTNVDPATGDGAIVDTIGTMRPPSKTPSTSPPTSAPTSPPTRGDGRLENPPIHRTNPRDEDVMSPGTRATPSGSPDALIAEIIGLAKGGGCSRVEDCHTLPVGHKACGGPRTYVVYCATTTDVAALERKIAELDALDRAAASAGAISDCMLAVAPTPVLRGGACRAGP